MTYFWDKINYSLKTITNVIDELDCELNRVNNNEEKIELLYFRIDWELKKIEHQLTQYFNEELPRHWYLLKKYPKVTLTSHTIFITIPTTTKVPTTKRYELVQWLKDRYETIENTGDKYATIVVNTQHRDGKKWI